LEVRASLRGDGILFGAARCLAVPRCFDAEAFAGARVLDGALF
jgi:hypothetical protein